MDTQETTLSPIFGKRKDKVTIIGQADAYWLVLIASFLGGRPGLTNNANGDWFQYYETKLRITECKTPRCCYIIEDCSKTESLLWDNVKNEIKILTPKDK